MAPGGARGVEVVPWTDATRRLEPRRRRHRGLRLRPAATPFVARMAAMPRPPVWINLEYLSAEPYVERSHGLPSPQLDGPGAG